MLSTELHRRTSLTPDGRPEKGGETPGRTTSKVLEFRQRGKIPEAKSQDNNSSLVTPRKLLAFVFNLTGMELVVG